MEPTAEIKKAIENKMAVMGTKETIKKLKQGKVQKVYVSSNCPGEIKEDLKHLCNVGKVEIIDLVLPNTELGIACKKPFSISVVSVIRGSKN